MKKVTALICLAICSMLQAQCAFAETPVELSLGLSVDVSRIQFNGLAYTPSAVVTNHFVAWRSVTEIRTNLYYGMQPDTVVTNTVQKQESFGSVITNAAKWETSFEYAIPAGTVLRIGDALSATPVRRADLTVRMEITPAQMTAILGAALYAQTLTAAQLFGTLPVSGNIAEALRAAVMAVLTQ